MIARLLSIFYLFIFVGQYQLGPRESSVNSSAVGQKGLREAVPPSALQSSGIAEEDSRKVLSSVGSLSGDIDRRASSIATLRMKARQHEMRIEATRKKHDWIVFVSLLCVALKIHLLAKTIVIPWMFADVLLLWRKNVPYLVYFITIEKNRYLKLIHVFIFYST